MDPAPTTTSISARIVDPVFAAVVLVNVLLLFKAIKLWRRTRRHYCPWEHRGSRTPATEASDAWPGHGSDWWHSPAASEKERAAIEDAKALLPGDALAWTLGRAVAFGAPAFEMELLRKLRTLPRTARTGERLAAVVGDALDWKRKHAAPHSPAAKRPTAGLAAADLSHGEWACRFLVMGMRCGRARGGHPVKIERIGANDMQGLAASPGGEEKLRLFYRSLLEELCASLNAESAACGALLRSYEVFDMRDLSLRNAFSPVVFRFTAEQLKVVGRVVRRSDARPPNEQIHRCVCNSPVRAAYRHSTPGRRSASQ
jgi:hypothetical protein